MGKQSAPLQPVPAMAVALAPDRHRLALPCLAGMTLANAELEALSAGKALRPLLQRTPVGPVAERRVIAPACQPWIVGAGPLANGLMLREMARLWTCPLGCRSTMRTTPPMELAKAALALGVAEWRQPGFDGLVTTGGSTWLVDGALLRPQCR